MAEYILKDDADRRQAIKKLEAAKLPCTVCIVQGQRRTVLQNKLQWKWLNEITQQRADESIEYYRGLTKLTLGVPILRNENPDFREKYDRIIKPHSFAEKVTMMMEPLDFPVTRLMTAKQKKLYLDEMYRHWTEQGIVLTDPDCKFDDQYMESYAAQR